MDFLESDLGSMSSWNPKKPHEKRRVLHLPGLGHPEVPDFSREINWLGVPAAFSIKMAWTEDMPQVHSLTWGLLCEKSCDWTVSCSYQDAIGMYPIFRPHLRSSEFNDTDVSNLEISMIRIEAANVKVKDVANHPNLWLSQWLDHFPRNHPMCSENPPFQQWYCWAYGCLLGVAIFGDICMLLH